MKKSNYTFLSDDTPNKTYCIIYQSNKLFKITEKTLIRTNRMT